MRLLLHLLVVVLQRKRHRPQSLAAPEQFRTQELQELRREIIPSGFAEPGDEVLRREVLGRAESWKTYWRHAVCDFG